MTLAVAGPRSLSVRLRDGTRLDANLWAPEAPGRFPVLLMRQPYGRRIASTLVYAHPTWYAAHGYLVVVQDVRGSGTSEGSFRLFADEAADGAEAVAWAADLPGADGRVGMHGFSYQGEAQLLALAGGARPDAVAPAMAGWDLRTDWAWEGGAWWRLAPNLGWGLQMAWLRAVHAGEAAAAAELQKAARALPVERHRTMPDVVRRHATLSHYGDWLARPDPDPYWDALAPRARLAGLPLNIPALHVGGWNDPMLMGTLDGHAAFAATGAAEQRLVVGPWTHAPWGRRVGAGDLGPNAVSPVDGAQLAWFDRQLKGRNGHAGAPVTLFDLGARTWRDFGEWPGTSALELFPQSGGLAAATSADGALHRAPGPPGSDTFVHDPWRPVPSLGGSAGPPPGIQDRAALDDRADVLCYTAKPLASPLLLCGRVRAVLHAEADQPSFDLSATLSVVAPDGRAWTLTAGHRRCDAGGEIEVPMPATCATLPAGHALRLSIAAAAFPAYAVNPGDGRPASEFTADAEQVTTITVRHGGATPSRLCLPEVA